MKNKKIKCHEAARHFLDNAVIINCLWSNFVKLLLARSCFQR
jgi:hypothetical protein